MKKCNLCDLCFLAFSVFLLGSSITLTILSVFNIIIINNVFLYAYNLTAFSLAFIFGVGIYREETDKNSL